MNCAQIKLFWAGILVSRNELHLMLAVCSIRPDYSIATWNQAMEVFSDLAAQEVIGSSLFRLPQPWRHRLLDFVESEATQSLRVEFNNHLLLNLHKATMEGSALSNNHGDELFIVIEKTNETHLLDSPLLHKERLASIGQVAAGVAHEIGNPVTGIACLAQNIKIETNDSKMQAIANQILEQTDRISTILQSLTYFVHGESQGKKLKTRVQIKSCIDNAINLLSLAHKDSNGRFDSHCPPDLFVAGDSQRLTQVFINILTNARDASPEEACVEIKAKSENGEIRVQVLDQGPGIPAEMINSIFEPFFTTKDPGKGTGLGLAIVKSIINEHMGKIYAESPVKRPMKNLLRSSVNNSVRSQEKSPAEKSKTQADNTEYPGTRLTVLLPEYKSSDSQV